MRNIYISALHALLLAIMPTILTSCTQCNAENKGQMKDMQQNRTAGKIVGSYTEETEGIHFTLNGVEFKMVTVEGGTFTMDITTANRTKNRNIRLRYPPFG